MAPKKTAITPCLMCNFGILLYSLKTVLDIQNLAQKRLDEAKLLLSNDYAEGGFYLAGYSIELMLKARICKHLEIEDFYLKQPEPLKKAYFVHNLDQLLTLSGLRKRFEDATDPLKGNDAALNKNWNKICSWNEGARYDCHVQDKDAVAFINAIENPKNGFLLWLRKNW